MPKLSRRKLIVGGLVGGAFAVGYSLIPAKQKWNGPLGDGEVLVNNWVKIGPDGNITVYVAQAEMGQGTHSGFATLIAEEMNADWDRMEVKPAPDHPSYTNLTFVNSVVPFVGALPESLQPAGAWLLKEVIERAGGMIATGGSTSMVDKYMRLREAGALARMTMEQAAANIWGVPAEDCTTDNSVVFHKASGKQLDFAELVEEAAKTEVKGEVKIKPDAQLTRVGKEGTPRLDIPSKVDGTAVFGADIRLEGMVYAAVRNGGSSLGEIVGVDKAGAMQSSGVIDVVHTPTWVGVVAKTQWHAQNALDAMEIEWDHSKGAVMVNDWQEKRLYQTSQNDAPTTMIHQDEAIETAFADSADVITATYAVPYLAHACLETVNATARWDGESLEIWAPNQSPTIVKAAVSAALGVDAAAITCHTTLLGGGFGRKVDPDYVIQAASLARAVQRPVQLIWSRKEDMHCDTFRPAAATTMTAAIGADGEIKAVKTHVASQSVGTDFQARWFGGSGVYEGNDPSTVEGLEVLPYDYGAYQLGYSNMPAPAQLGYWRSVGHSYTAYFAEAFADEMAARVGEDPLDFRLKRVKDPRAKNLLETVADMSGYRTSVPEGRYQGVSFHESFGSMVAMVAEISPPADGEELPKVERVFAAIDCGIPVNPDSIRAQIESSVVFGLTAALYGEIVFDEGVPTYDNFDGYQLLTLAQTPETHVKMVASDAPIGGVGEPGVPPVAPALANAIRNWTGTPVRALPLMKHFKAPRDENTIASAAGF
ncbi:MAG: molybdopterin cofactor-binding domain-containing protein [Pseudomonadota bacterium]